MFAEVPKGKYVIIKGNTADANADFLRAGYEEVIGEAVTSGDIEIVGETYTDNWDPAKAQTSMEQFLTAENNEIDAVLSENDGMAGGVVAALEAQGLAGKIPVSGQDGDQAALNRIALGTQTVDVWKDARGSARPPVRPPSQLCANPDASTVDGTAPFTTPGGVEVQLDPAHADRDHPGQPRRRRRRGMDRRRTRLRGRRRRFGGRLRLTRRTRRTPRPCTTGEGYARSTSTI